MKTLAPALLSFWLAGATYAGDGVDVSSDALRRCAAAGIAECQFKLAQQLEASEAGHSEAKRLYEQAYAAGYQAAGPALLALVAKSAPSPSPSPARETPRLATTAPLSGGSSLPLGCAMEQTAQTGCPLSLEAFTLKQTDKRVVVQLRITNRTAETVHIKRTDLHASQRGKPLVVSEALTRHGQRFSELAGFLLGAAVETAGNDLDIGSEVIRDNVASDLGNSVSEAVASNGAQVDPGADLPYLSSDAVEPGTTLDAVVEVQTPERSGRVELELSVSGANVRTTVAPLPVR